jgi:hypothetical protein
VKNKPKSQPSFLSLSSLSLSFVPNSFPVTAFKNSTGYKKGFRLFNLFFIIDLSKIHEGLLLKQMLRENELEGESLSIGFILVAF